jgi:PIN domain nuclease of toxin-antitoxin system
LSAVLLDTCAVLWLANGDPMDEAARDAIRGAQAAEAALVSPMTAWEIATKTAKGKLLLDDTPDAWLARLMALPGLRLADLTPAILIASTRLPGTPPTDPVDRIIIATQRAVGAPVVTRDSRILAYAEAGHGQAIRC